MPSPEQNPTDPRPDNASTGNSTPNQGSENDATISTTPNIDTDTNHDPENNGLTPRSTEENMGDGAGIRGGYGDASQTNGLEGGPDQSAPDRPLTDTELTGS